MRLTKPNVARLTLPPGKSELLVFDDALPGFGLRIRAGGKRTWIAQYRVGSKQRRVSLGTVEALNADKAREAARGILAKVQLGGDPQTEKAESRARAAVTLGSVAKRYLEEHAKPKLKPRSYEEIERHLTHHWAAMGELPLHQIKRGTVAVRLSEIARERGPFASNRARASLSALFTWAMGEGLAETNPVVGTNKAADEISRDHVLKDQELAAIWKACRDDDHGRIVRLLLLTGQRRAEVGALGWSEIDEAQALWTIPRERTKNGLPHDVPLSDAALDILRDAPRRDGRGLVFGDGAGGFQGWSKAKAALDKRIIEAGKKVRPWRLHDIRRTVATRLGELGILPHVIEAILNHVSGHKAGVAGVYNRATYAKEKRQALAHWAAHVAALVKDESSRSDA
ncbi:site-specific integrase [Microvirga sp. VF16]|uniref:tyrosine-type recombinase/integrase n=1 Tax=Microvirga sp. VF16 TaxID=2807101 RepID=UPI00193E3C1F|nr:site-specific integrase [Microvirga sp. VF16]QRM28680.1 tyrosine-type recombinase/integrase [Microvirga sp. VF16]